MVVGHTGGPDEAVNLRRFLPVKTRADNPRCQLWKEMLSYVGGGS